MRNGSGTTSAATVPSCRSLTRLASVSKPMRLILSPVVLFGVLASTWAAPCVITGSAAQTPHDDGAAGGPTGGDRLGDDGERPIARGQLLGESLDALFEGGDAGRSY